jgi:hypothetical protein
LTIVRGQAPNTDGASRLRAGGALDRLACAGAVSRPRRGRRPVAPDASLFVRAIALKVHELHDNDEHYGNLRREM